jgi:hypothetical protein
MPATKTLIAMQNLAENLQRVRPVSSGEAVQEHSCAVPKLVLNIAGNLKEIEAPHQFANLQ